MKGIIFSEFIEYVEEQFSPDIADDIINASELPTGGAYTAVGTYDHNELLTLFTALSTTTGNQISELIRAYGRYLFNRFTDAYPQFINETESAFSFLQDVDDHIHVEVYKLYPEAELPQFDYDFPGPNQMIMTYRSARPLADLAEGLILGCIEYFGEDISLERENLQPLDKTTAKFILTKRD